MVKDLLNATPAKDKTRACFLLHVRPDKLEEYVEVHQHVWDSMRQALTIAGWRHYSLFLDPETGLVVGYFEADDTTAAMNNMTESPTNTQWQQHMQQYFTQPDGGTAHLLHQYFYLR